jgi:hypothetical protein
MNLNNNNNNPPMSAKTRRQRKREYNATPQNQPQPKRQKPNPGEQTRQRKRTARNARAFADRALAGKGRTKNGTTNRANFVIEEDEYIAEVTPANEPAFNVVQYPVNPGQVSMFPWLSTIAKNFEKYCFEYLEFYYKREVSEFATNGQTGKVIYSFDTDASDPAPFGKQEMEATDPHEDALPSENFRLPIPKKMLLPLLSDAHFVRPGALPANTDLKTYDVGTLNVATQATAANTATGELHVRYRVRLMIPVLPPGGSQGSAILVQGGGSLAAATPFGSVPTVTGSITLAAAATNVLSISNVQIGQELSIKVALDGTVLGAPSFTAPVGLTLKTALLAVAGAAQTQSALWSTYTVTALNPSITVTTTATTITFAVAEVSVAAPPSTV